MNTIQKKCYQFEKKVDNKLNTMQKDGVEKLRIQVFELIVDFLSNYRNNLN